MMTLTYILAGVILLGICVFVHEFGHLIGARIVGIKVKVFSIGYGKGILKKQIGDTTYQITLIPLGGYCKFYGDDPNEKREGKSYEFLSAHPLKRVVVVILGPLFNLFLGIILFFIMNLVGYTAETNKIMIPDEYKTGEYLSPAYSSGLRDGDKIIEINNKKTNNYTDVRSTIIFSGGKELFIKAERENRVMEFKVRPKKYTDKGYYAIGIYPYSKNVLVINTLPGEPAANAGIQEFDELKSINGKPVESAEKFLDTIRTNPGKDLNLTIIRKEREFNITVKPRIKEALTIKQFEDSRFKGEKFDIDMDKIDIIKNSIENKHLKINDTTITSIDNLKKVLNDNKGKIITLTNSGGTYSGILSFDTFGFIGIGRPAMSPEMIEIKYGVAEGFIRAFVEPYNFIILNLKSFGMLFSGQLEMNQLSGPVRIVKIAGDVAYYQGISAFILLLAQISIALMIMNLLPIPVVDGSFILFFLFEAIRRKPINEKVLASIQFVGMGLLILLGIFVIFNDLSSFSFFQKLIK